MRLNHNSGSFPLDFFFLRAGDNIEIVAMEFFGDFDKGVEFAFAGFLRSHVVADLDC